MIKLAVAIILLSVALAGCSRTDEYFEDVVSHSVKRLRQRDLSPSIAII